MNWFALQPVSAESIIQAFLPVVEVFGVILAIIAVFTLSLAVLHIILAVRSTDEQVKSCPILAVKRHVDRSPRTRASARRVLQNSHLAGWLFTRG